LKRLEKECKSTKPFIGAVEVAKLAKEKGAISDARTGLADICAAVLHEKLDKTTTVRVSTEWDNSELSSEQKEYAALDALASLKIYHRLAQVPTSDKVSDTAIPGTPVSVLQDDGQVIAQGIISLTTSESTCRGLKQTKTRAHVTIQKVIIPAAILPLHNNVSLGSIDSVPFDILVKCTKLRNCITVQNQSAQTEVPLPSTSQSTPIYTATQQKLFQWFSLYVSSDSNWTEGVDDPSDTTAEEEDDMGDAQSDRLSLEEGIALLAEIEKNPSAWPTWIRSRVLMDIWHAMARIKVSKEHGFRRIFARALRDAMLIPDLDDKKRIEAYLNSIGSSWDDVLQFNAKWLWKRCKRTIPPPELLYPVVKEVYLTYGPLLDSKTQKPLFNSQAWKDAANVLKAIHAGLLSDPPGIPLYFQMGVDKKHGNLPIYRCARGTNNAEGGVHLSGRRHLPISGVSTRHASTRLRDFVLMHNLVVCGHIYNFEYTVYLYFILRLEL
jgi:3'-5' exonuclease